MRDLDQLLHSFAAIQPRLAGRADAIGGLANVIASALPILVERLQADADGEQRPAPMLVFGGMLQCSPLRPITPPATPATPLSVAQLCQEAGVLFSHTLTLWQLQEPSQASFEQLAGRLRSCGDQLLRTVGQQSEEARGRIQQVQQTTLELRQATHAASRLEVQRQELQEQQLSLQRRVDSVRAELAGQEGSLSDLEAEEIRLSTELLEARKVTQRVCDLKGELSELQQQLTDAEHDRDQIFQQTYDLRSKLRDTQSLVQEARRHSPAEVFERLERIWKEIPTDAFDNLMRT